MTGFLDLLARLKTFARDERGVSAVEFALIAPVLVALYLGSVQLSLAFSAERKLTGAVTAMGDLVARDDVLDNGELAEIQAAGEAIMQPFEAGALNVRISSVRMDADGRTFVDWSEASGLDPHAPGSDPGLPEGILGPDQSVILVEGEYAFSTPFDTLEISPVTLTDTVYQRPRRASHVRRG